MKVYLMARFLDKALMQEYAKQLEAIGVEVTSRWLQESAKPDCHMDEFAASYLLNTAIVDLEDIRRSDVCVLFTVDPKTPTVRGGRHFESGYAYGIGKPLITVGPVENIFHYLPDIKNFSTFEEAKVFLLERKYATRFDPTISNPCGIQPTTGLIWSSNGTTVRY